MRYSLRIAAVFTLIAAVSAIPLRSTSDVEARGLEARHTQQECEAICTLAGAQGAAWDRCVRDCVARNYPTPPPSPHPAPAPNPHPAPNPAPNTHHHRREEEDSSLVARHTQQECEVACTLAGHHGAAWNQCVRECMATNYPTPPPSPHGHKREVAELEARHTQQECEVACTLAGHHGAAWNQCVRECMATNYPTPPPSPHGHKREVAQLEARHTQQECEVACTLAGHHGAAWNQCVRECMATNYPTPPPSPHGHKREVSQLEARHTQQECEVACTLAGHHGAAWNQCVRECMATNYPTPPPSPHGHKREIDEVVAEARFDLEDDMLSARSSFESAVLVARHTQQECEVACTLAGHQGAAWSACVRACVARNYPTPPPSPHH